MVPVPPAPQTIWPAKGNPWKQPHMVEAAACHAGLPAPDEMMGFVFSFLGLHHSSVPTSSAVTGCIGPVWSSFNFSFKEKQRSSCSPQRQDPLLHPRQPLVLQLFPHAMRRGRGQGGVGQGSIGLLGDRCEARSALHPAALQLEGQPGGPREWCSRCQAPYPVPHFPQPPNAFCLAVGLVAEKVALS